jgi:hypothetical protein
MNYVPGAVGRARFRTMADDELKEIFDEHDVKYGAVIEMLSEVVKW